MRGKNPQLGKSLEGLAAQIEERTRPLTKNTYLASQYRAWRGDAAGSALSWRWHSMLVIFYHMLKSGASHSDWVAASLTVSNRSV